MSMLRAVFTGLCLFLLLPGCRKESARLRDMPSLMLWAWESPQDLRFLEHGEGVAFLGGELLLEGRTARWTPRRNPLLVSPGTFLIAVLRVETRAADHTPEQAEAIADRATGLLSLPRVKGLQVDFDARDSERAFYADALRRLSRRLPADLPLSITALASWCLDDGWISEAGLGGIVDEAVPMLFRMGPEEARIRQRLARGERFREPLARFSAGISTDELLPRLRGRRRYYVFHPGSWTPDAWNRIARELP
jgi:hypothetical protein